jgi:beta-mannosidase
MFWPSSPCAGPGSFADNWQNDAEGDMHNWQVWHKNRPFDAYYSYRPRFCSEFGYQSFPSMEVAETFATREQILSRAPEFEWHQKNDGGNARIRETMLRYFNPPKDVEAELLLSQFQQGIAIKMGVEGWRAQRPRCMGTLYWQLNDNWPVASWSSLEYGGKWKPLHYMAKRFFAPVAVVAQPEINNGEANIKKGGIYALNDTAETLKGELLVEYWSYDGKIVSSEKSAVTLSPDSSTRVGSFAQPVDSEEPVFLHLTLTTSKGVSRNDWHFGFYKDMPLADAKVSVKLDGNKLTLSSDKPAFFVWANVYGCGGEFDDNSFTLLPGRPRTLEWKSSWKNEKNVRMPAKALTVSHLKTCSRK